MVPPWRLDLCRPHDRLVRSSRLLLSLLLPQPGFDREGPQLMPFDLDILINAPWSIDDFRRIEYGRTAGHGGTCRLRSQRVWGRSLKVEPIGVIPGGKGLPDTR